MDKHIDCSGIIFISDFDSSNIAKVEFVPPTERKRELIDKEDSVITDYEFNIWTRADCSGTEFENNNRTWFYFGVKGGVSTNRIKLNVCNLNRQMKLYKEGMAAVYKISPGSSKWERVKNNWSYSWEAGTIALTFDYEPSENICSTTYFAFTYPYSFTDLQNTYVNIETRLKKYNIGNDLPGTHPDDIYYYRECLVKSLENRPIDLITISSYHGITNLRESRLSGLFPDKNIARPFQFKNKKIIFFSARVHPGETPSSFVMNGVLKLLLNKSDTVAVALRKLYVFKLVPMLNPDGVSRGFFRTDTRGVNLNRYYLNPSRKLHPSVFAARSLILYYHSGGEIREDDDEMTLSNESEKAENVVVTDSLTNDESQRSFVKTIETEHSAIEIDIMPSLSRTSSGDELNPNISKLRTSDYQRIPMHDLFELHAISDKKTSYRRLSSNNAGAAQITSESNLFLYMDFHAHASKRGIFMYGNHFDNIADKVDSMLLAKLMSINNQHFHYNSCNFSKRNMCTKDRDGLSKEGSGRVATFKITGLIRSYTLECNYNTGSTVNIMPPTPKPLGKRLLRPLLVPPKYTPKIYEEIGRALCVSILDMTGNNPNSRLETSQYRSLNGLKEALRLEIVSSGVLNLKKSNRSRAFRRIKRSSTMVVQTIDNDNSKTIKSNNKRIKKVLKKASICCSRQIHSSSHQICCSSTTAAAAATSATTTSCSQPSSSSLIGVLSSDDLSTIVVNTLPSVVAISRGKTNKKDRRRTNEKLTLVKKRVVNLLKTDKKKNSIRKNKLGRFITKKKDNNRKKSALRCSALSVQNNSNNSSNNNNNNKNYDDNNYGGSNKNNGLDKLEKRFSSSKKQGKILKSKKSSTRLAT